MLMAISRQTVSRIVSAKQLEAYAPSRQPLVQRRATRGVRHFHGEV